MPPPPLSSTTLALPAAVLSTALPQSTPEDTHTSARDRCQTPPAQNELPEPPVRPRHLGAHAHLHLHASRCRAFPCTPIQRTVCTCSAGHVGAAPRHAAALGCAARVPCIMRPEPWPRHTSPAWRRHASARAAAPHSVRPQPAPCPMPALHVAQPAMRQRSALWTHHRRGASTDASSAAPDGQQRGLPLTEHTGGAHSARHTSPAVELTIAASSQSQPSRARSVT